MKDLSLYRFISQILVLIGGINWGLVGLFHVDIITGIFGGLLGRLIFIVVGVAAGFLIYEMYLEKMKKS